MSPPALLGTRGRLRNALAVSALLPVVGLVMMSWPDTARAELPAPVRDASLELPAQQAEWSARHCDGVAFLRGFITREVNGRPRRQPEWGIEPAALKGCELYVVRVTQVHDQGATFSRPPRVTLAVEQVLLGEPQAQPLAAVFSILVEGHLCGNGHVEEVSRRAQQPLRGPEVGARLVVAGAWNKERTWFEVNDRNRWPATDARLEEAAKALETARREDPAFDQRIAAQRADDLAARTDPLLLRVVKAGNREGTQFLLEAGARAAAVDEGNLSALDHAVKRKDVPMISLLLRHLPRGTEDAQAVMQAIDDVALVRMLLEGGVSWMGPRRGYSPMHHAAQRGACETLRLLLQRGADPDGPQSGAQTPLHDATRSTQGLPCVPLLLEAGARADASNGGWTPLSYAASLPYTPEAERAIRALVAHGARVNRLMPNKETLLRSARKAARRDSRMVELLESLGAR